MFLSFMAASCNHPGPLVHERVLITHPCRFSLIPAIAACVRGDCNPWYVPSSNSRHVIIMSQKFCHPPNQGVTFYSRLALMSLFTNPVAKTIFFL